MQYGVLMVRARDHLGYLFLRRAARIQLGLFGILGVCIIHPGSEFLSWDSTEESRGVGVVSWVSRNHYVRLFEFGLSSGSSFGLGVVVSVWVLWPGFP